MLQVRVEIDGAPAWGRLEGDTVVLDDGRRVAAADARWLAPATPSKIIAVHLTYRSRLVEYAVRLSAASRPGRPGSADFINQYVSWGAGTRASQNLILGGKARALLLGRAHVSADDIKSLAHPVLRHRILLNYKAEAEGMNVERVIDRLLESVPAVP